MKIQDYALIGDCTRSAYRGHTLVLETEFETAEGAVTLVYFMPMRTAQCD